MKPIARPWALLGLPALFMAACIAFDDSESEFCRTADAPRRVAICGEILETPQGTGSSDAGPGDAGSDGSCSQDSQCTTPPDQCHETTGTCVSGSCEYPQKQTGSVCNDAIPTGVCFSSSGTCEAGLCRASYKARGASCEDGQLCTVNDTCDGAGNCVGGGPRACNSPPNPCFEPSGTCASDTCTYKPIAKGKLCDDGNSCTVSDQCNGAGICVGTEKVCNSPPDQCLQSSGTCNSSTGDCVYPPQPSGTGCQPDNLCKTGACNGAGACVETGAVFCASTRCKTAMGTCNPAVGCDYNDWCADAGGVCSEDCCRDPSNGLCMAF
ncbi:hypothetical protein ATI61_101495 [Archangium gephyra]|uniref:Dickkopf N-terminal cysteine-rich domain-containing protein n=1 Tax=Archangium gephyra TaxID=48 RepID=A0ABX9KBS1_9BACT|nr:hypothetical protein ATI61_101495 [Archangium gephyra]